MARSRFDLLLLDEGEYYLEDYSVFEYPHPVPARTSLQQALDRRVQGRLKLCTRCLVFEPQDTTMPLVKFPYRKMRTSVSRFRAQGGVDVPLGADAPEFFEIDCPEWIEAKANNVIGAYQNRSGTPDDGTSPSLRLFSLL